MIFGYNGLIFKIIEYQAALKIDVSTMLKLTTC